MKKRWKPHEDEIIVNDYLNLPVLSRKWDKVDTSLSRYEVAAHRAEQVRELFLLGKRQTDIAALLGVGDSCISNLMKKNGICKKGGV